MSAQPKPTGKTKPAPADKLADVVDRVRTDAKERPRQYLRDSQVPAGGE